MFYNFIFPYFHFVTGMNLLRYITFRTLCALFTSLIISFLLYPTFIHHDHFAQPIRTDGPESHIIKKRGTPTMGGTIIIAGTVLSSLLWGNLNNPYLWAIIGLTVVYSILGLADDLLKVKYNTPEGVHGRVKLIVQFAAAIAFSFFIEMYRPDGLKGQLTFPFVKDVMLNLGVFITLFTSFVIVGSSNAVNLTDGLDGLATFPSMLAALCLGIIAYVTGHIIFANYLQLAYIPMSGELCIFCGALIGACLGFLWYNAPPAQIFMGDTGSLAIGGALGGISVITKNEFVLAIIGGLFVIEAVSVMLQVGYYKLTKKRIFLMAPIHHHFEKLGWAESTVVIRFWILSFVFALIGLATLKIR